MKCTSDLKVCPPCSHDGDVVHVFVTGTQLVGGLEDFICFHILGTIIPFD